MESGQIPFLVLTDKKNLELARVIQNKNRYGLSAKKENWLVVFTVDSGYDTIYYSPEGRQESEAYRIAKQYIASSTIIFDQIWFTNLITRPYRLYPDGCA